MFTLVEQSSYRVPGPAESYIYEIVSSAVGIAAISSDDALRVLNPAHLSGPELFTLPQVHNAVTCLSILDMAGNVFGTAGRDGEIKIWDVRCGQLVASTNSGWYFLFVCRAIKKNSLYADQFHHMLMVSLSVQNAPILSLASNSQNMLAVGTELHNYQACILVR